ncbi:hypothetical protein L596_000193 [Steinernema carpocapsae]|uniref:BRCT domain-containing protein n=1 Tax=Steinernema carpocapsae TaxID=34508 RepID=A0A4U8UH68_STECR|nr:hypothetical protein L596_000193 [Steinernema carpocapsae]
MKEEERLNKGGEGIEVVDGNMVGENEIAEGEGGSIQGDERSSDGEERMEREEGNLKRIFTGMYFVLTTARREGDKDYEYLDKDEVGEVISTLGGRVIRDLMTIDRRCELMLISEDAYKTAKYLSALVLGVPCVHFEWIRQCILSGDFLDYRKYLLPAGIDIVTGQSVKWHGKVSLLQEKTMYICGSKEKEVKGRIKKAFNATWSTMTRAMGAELLETLPNDPTGIFCVVTDGQDCPEMISKALQLQVPLVTAEWLIGCLIRGDVVDFDAHPKFRYGNGEGVEQK